MAEKKRRFAVLTGGGDCPGLNAVIRAVIKTFLQNDCEVFGIYNGFNGLINGNLKLMNYADVSGILPRGGTILGTTNRDNPFKFAVEENGELVYYDMRDKVVENLQKHDIEALVVIGGDGSLNIGAKLARECGIKVVGVPKTIDNDLPCTERTFGFDTAVAMATEAVDRLHTTSAPAAPDSAPASRQTGRHSAALRSGGFFPHPGTAGRWWQRCCPRPAASPKEPAPGACPAATPGTPVNGGSARICARRRCPKDQRQRADARFPWSQ